MNTSTTDSSLKGVNPSLMAVAAASRPDFEAALLELAKNPERQGRALYDLAKIFFDKCDLHTAIKYFEQAKPFFKNIEHFYSLVKILGFQIRIYFESQDVAKASEYIQELSLLLECAPKEIDRSKAEYIFYRGQLETYRQNGLKALEFLELAHTKAITENESELLAKCLYSLAQICYQGKEYQRALTYLEQLRELLFILKKSYLSGSLNLLLGRIYMEIDQSEKSLDALNKANQSLQKRTYWNLYGYVLLCQAQVYKRVGELTKSMVYFEWLQSLYGHSPFRRLSSLINVEMSELRDSNVDLYLDRDRRLVHERTLGTIDFKHRFVLLEILFLLAQNPGVYFDKEVLARSIWKDEYNPLIHDKLIYTSVSRLRKLIEPTGADKRKYVLRGKDGYTFNPHVRIRFGRNQELAPEKDRFIPDIFTPV